MGSSIGLYILIIVVARDRQRVLGKRVSIETVGLFKLPILEFQKKDKRGKRKPDDLLITKEPERSSKGKKHQTTEPAPNTRFRKNASSR